MRSTRVWKTGLMLCTAAAVGIVGVATMAAQETKNKERRGERAANQPTLSARVSNAQAMTREESMARGKLDAAHKQAITTEIKPPSPELAKRLSELANGASYDALLAFQAEVDAIVNGAVLSDEWMEFQLQLDGLIESTYNAKMENARRSALVNREVQADGSVAGGGETCATAMSLGSGPTSHSGSLAGSPADMGDGPTPTCGSLSQVDDWYSWSTACPGSGTATASLCTSGGPPYDDSILAVFSTCAGPQVACDDDACPGATAPTGPGYLSQVSWAVSSGGSYILRVSPWGGAGTMGAYELVITEVCPVCGNGTVEAPEQCDDGNTNNNDGCSGTCVEEGACCIKGMGSCSCMNLTAADCALAGGVYRGNASLCGMGLLGNCDCNGNSICDQNDLLPTGGTLRPYAIEIDPDIVITTSAGASPCGTCPAGMVCVDVNADGIIGPAPDRCGFCNTFVVPDSGIISDVNVDFTWTANHTWYGDVIMNVAHGGVQVSILSGTSSSSSDLLGTYIADDEATTTFDAAATAAGGGANVIPPGSYRPAGLLSAFDGLNKMGAWTLCVADDAAGDGGTLGAWSLEIQNNATPPVGTDCNSNFILDACEGVNPAAGACCVSGSCSEVMGAGACSGIYFGNCTTCASVVCPACGNGQLDTGEECDDGNTMNSDGCSSVCLCEPATPHDTCATANASDTIVPSNYTGNNQCSMDDMGTCTVSSPNQALWYQVTGDGNTLRATTCTPGTDYDTMIQVWCGNCTSLVCVGGNDDQSGAFDPACDTLGTMVNRGSTVTWCSSPGTIYYIAVGGFSASEGNHELSVTSNGMPCMGAISCVPPTGACCKLDGTCFDGLTSGDCALSGGTYQGNDSMCMDIVCPVCGNGILESGEQCDDGNTNNGDGCSNSCQCEAGPPSNDNCANRIVLPSGDGVYFFSTNGATTDGPSHASCQFDGQTYADVWYNWNSGSCDGVLVVSTCGTINYDSDIVVYQGCDCGPGLENPPLGCNDDGPGCAGFSSRVEVPVDPSTCYKIRIGGWNSVADVGCGTFSVTCITPDCGNNVVEPGEECDDGNTMSGDGCSASCQNEGACCNGNACVQVSDTACGALDGTYLGDGVACGSQCAFGACCIGTQGQCEETSFKCCAEQGGSYAAATSCAAANCPCNVTCGMGKIPEGEANCGLPTDTVNGGCNSTPFVTQPISCGQGYCGTAAFDGSLRDTDWYSFTVPAGPDQYVTWSATAEFDVLLIIVSSSNGTNCGGASIVALADGPACSTTSVSACLPPGTYELFIAPQFTAVEACGAEYTATVTCGACPPPPPAPADNCPATSLGMLAGPGSVDGTLAGSTDNFPAPVGCASPAPCGFYGNGNDVIYEFTPTVSGNWTFSLCGSSPDWDSSIQIREGGACPGASCVAADDDSCLGCNSPYEATVTAALSAGTTYWVIVDSFSTGGANNFTLSWSVAPTPTGACCGAAPACSCTIQTAAACALAGGAYKGNNSTCGANTCDCNMNSVCDQLDLLPSGGQVKSEVYDTAPLPLAIPDCAGGLDNPVSDTRTFVTGPCGPIVDLDVDLIITHTWVGDLHVTLTHVSSGTTAQLLRRVGLAETGPLCSNASCCGNSSANVNIILDDEATNCVETGPFPLAGGARYRPSGGAATGAGTATCVAMGNLSVFDGLEKCGDWTLTVSDGAGGDTGTLVQWSLHFVNVPQNPPVATDCNGNTIPDSCELAANDCNGNNILDACELAGNDNIPPGGDGIPDDCNCINDSDCGAGQVCNVCDFVCEAGGCPCVTAVDCRTQIPGMPPTPLCPDDNACNCVQCIAGTCVFSCTGFGNVNCSGPINLDDILCVLGGFANYADCPNGDISPCGGNGIINLDDILASLNAFGGQNPCGCMPAGVPPLCGSSQP